MFYFKTLQKKAANKIGNVKSEITFVKQIYYEVLFLFLFFLFYICRIGWIISCFFFLLLLRAGQISAFLATQ